MKKTALPVVATLALFSLTTGCSPQGGAADPTSSEAVAEASPEGSTPGGTDPDRSAQGAEVPIWTPTRPSDAKVPAVEGALESHPGDEDSFYVTSDDYVVWARSSANTEADLEYRVVNFDKNGWQSSAFMKYVFADASDAQAFAATNELLVPDGVVVYYKGWFGAQVRDKASVVELVKTEAEEYFVSKP